jgi:hypothetical protein
MQMAVSVKAIKLWRSEIASKPGALSEIHSRWLRSSPVSGQPPCSAKEQRLLKNSSKKK